MRTRGSILSSLRGRRPQHAPKRPDRRSELFVDAWDKLRLRSLVVILQRDEEALQPSQRPKRYDQDQRDPKRRVDPIWRLILDLGYERRADDDGAGDHDDEYSGPVTRVREGEIHAARFAFGFQRQEPVEQLSLAAARASAQQPREIGRRTDCRELLFCDHGIGLCAVRTAANADVGPAASEG